MNHGAKLRHWARGVLSFSYFFLLFLTFFLKKLLGLKMRAEIMFYVSHPDGSAGMWAGIGASALRARRR